MPQFFTKFKLTGMFGMSKSKNNTAGQPDSSTPLVLALNPFVTSCINFFFSLQFPSLAFRSRFWLIWFINQRALHNHALSVVRHRPAVLSASSVHTSSNHSLRHRNFMFGMIVPICTKCTYVKCLVILTCSCQMTAILLLFFDLLSCPYKQS